jgi:hypothetical protein
MVCIEEWFVLKSCEKSRFVCVDSWLRSLLATPLRFEPHHDVFPS